MWWVKSRRDKKTPCISSSQTSPSSCGSWPAMKQTTASLSAPWRATLTLLAMLLSPPTDSLPCLEPGIAPSVCGTSARKYRPYGKGDSLCSTIPKRMYFQPSAHSYLLSFPGYISTDCSVYPQNFDMGFALQLWETHLNQLKFPNRIN